MAAQKESAMESSQRNGTAGTGGTRRATASTAAATILAVLALASTACQTNPRASARAYVARGDRYVAHKQYRRAAIEFRNALQQQPRDARARYRLAQTENRLGEWHESYRDLERVAAEQPSFVPARLDLAELYLAARQPVLAAEEIRRARKVAPNDPRVALLQMKLDLTTGRLHRAQGDCAALTRLDGADDRAHALCGLADLGNKDYAAAETEFRTAMRIAPAAPESVGNLANLLDLEGKTAQAESLVGAAVARDPKSLDLALTLADLYVRHGDIASAGALFAAFVRGNGDAPGTLVTLGHFWMWRNHLSRAVAEFRAADAASPGALAEKNLASAYLTLHDLHRAARYTRAVLRRDPADPDGIALEGALDALAGDNAKAEPLLESARKANPSSLVANYYLGLVWQATGQTDRARQAFGDCVQENGKFVAAYVHLGQIALESGDAKLGASYARKILAVDSGSLDGYLLLAQADMMSGDLAGAGRILSAGEKLPHPPLPLVEVALRYDVLRRNFTAADAAFRRELAATSDPAPLAASYAAALAASGQPNRAIRPVETAIAARPRDASLHLLLARLDYQTGHLAGAQREARVALSGGATAGLARELLGEIAGREGHAKEAADEYGAAIRAMPGDPSGYLLAGDMMMRQGRYREAEREFGAARIVSPGSDPVNLALAYCWAQLGANLDQALGLAQQLKSRYPENPQVADTLGWIYFRKGIYPLAIEQLQFAARRAPADAAIEFHLGLALVADGDRAAGKAALLRALKLHLTARESAAARGALGESRQAEARRAGGR